MSTLSLDWLDKKRGEMELRVKQQVQLLRDLMRRRAERTGADRARMVASRDSDMLIYEDLMTALQSSSVVVPSEIHHAGVDDALGPFCLVRLRTPYGDTVLAGTPTSSAYDAPFGPFREEKRVRPWGTGLRSPTPTNIVKPIATADDLVEAVSDHGNPERMRRGVLLSEVVELDETQAAKLRGPLRAYIDRFYTTKEEDELTAVGAAVRTYIATSPPADLDQLGGLLASQPALPSALESEIAKMVVRKLTAHPPQEAGMYPSLTSQLAGLADAYFHPRILGRNYCGPAALNAAIATALLLSDKLKDIHSEARSRCPEWFQRQLGRRASTVATEMTSRHNEGAVAPQTSALRLLATLAE